MASSPIFGGSVRGESRQFVPGHGARPQELFTAGASGSVVDTIFATSNDAGANYVYLLIGTPLTLQANMGTGSFVDGGGAADTIHRTSGSFVTDGWLVGNLTLVWPVTTLANAFMELLTAVAAGDLSVATGKVAAAENLLAGAKIYRIHAVTRTTVAINAGLGNPAANSLNITDMPFLQGFPDSKIVLAANDVLFGYVGTLMGSGEVLNVRCTGVDF